MSQAKISFWQVFRLTFVIFSLYLLRDTFFRWDGFRYHSTFSEYLPGVALITIFWCILAAFTALMLWLLLRVFEWFSQSMGWKIRAEHLLLFIGTFVLLLAILWAGKRLIWSNVPLPILLKQVILFSVTFTAIFLTWLFRNKTDIIQERITPLVWLFGIWVIISMPLVAYHTWGKQGYNIVSQKTTQETDSNDRPNIILVTFDALAARNMSAYGYDRPTTPFIKKWAKTASLFTRLEAESNYTIPTLSSLMTSKRLWTHQTYHGHYPTKGVKSDIESLPLLLKNAGYYNMAFVVQVASVNRLGFSNGFDIAPLASEFWTPTSLTDVVYIKLYRLFGVKIALYDWIVKKDFIIGTLLNKTQNMISQNISKKTSPPETMYPPEKAFSRFLSVIDNNPPEPFFAWIHLYPPHDPYRPPDPYMGMFDSSPSPKTFEKIMKEFERIKKEKEWDIDSLRARYDEFIRYCDKQFEIFMEQLIKKNKLKNAVFIFSADHGESFEHDFLFHGDIHLYEEVTNIPLIIKEPGQTEGRIINDLIEQIDIPPTILDLANIPVPSWMEGRSLVPLMQGKKLSPRPAFSMAFERNPSRGHQITKGTIAVWDGDYKLIHYLKDEKSLLFNLKEDPDELNNLFNEKPEIGQRLFNLIKENLKKANERINRGE